jgi:hypothetical protein
VKTITEVAPDVVTLQEVLDPNALTALAQGLGYEAVVSEPDGRGNRVAALLRPTVQLVDSKPITAYQLPEGSTVQAFDKDEHVIASPSLSRPPLAVTVEHDGKTITLIVAHLKSKLQTFPNGQFSTKDEDLRAGVAFFDLGRRAAEAATIRGHVTAVLKQD